MPNKTPRTAPYPLRICSNLEMREIDRIAESEYGIDAVVLMENAGRAATQVLLERLPRAGLDSEVLVFAGKGNNAGDAFVVARRLLGLERKVRIFHFENKERYQGATQRNFEILRRLNAKMTYLENAHELEDFFERSSGPFIIVDGILGTGLKGHLEGLFADVIELINAAPSIEVIALDIPTGVSGDTGQIHGASIQATLTISFGFPKLGHFLPPGASRRGDLVNVDISLPARFRKEGDKFLLMPSVMSELLHERDRYGHKNSFGHTLLIGGTPGRLGAIVMTAQACLRMGTGLVTVASWPECFDALLQKLPAEVMLKPLPSATETGKLSGEWASLLSTFSSIVVGPGMGTRDDAKVILEELIKNYAGPLVLDADALNCISEFKLHGLLQARRSPTVLTPHPGEMARLIGKSKEEVTADPVAALKEAVALTHSIVLSKGAATLIASPDERLYLNHYPNDGMATAGSGDVLAGMIGGLVGQGVEPFQGTLLGIFLHSLAGDLAAQKLGHRSMTASDIIEHISHAFQNIKTRSEDQLPIEARLRLL